jgi:DNA-binding NtrC family response regulator
MSTNAKWIIGLLVAIVIGLVVGLVIVAGDDSDDDGTTTDVPTLTTGAAPTTTQPPTTTTPTTTIGPNYPGVATHVPYREARELMLSTWEHAYVEALLERHDGNVTRAAEAAGVSRKYLYDIIHRSGGDDTPPE